MRKGSHPVDTWASPGTKDFADRPIYFHVDAPLTKSELLYAIATTFTLNNLAVIPVDDHTIRLGSLSEVPRNKANPP